MADQVLKLAIGADVAGLEQGLNRAEASVKTFEGNVKKATPAVNNAGASLVNLGRIASDLPFGFIAIQNNLDPLVQSLGTLSKQSGGAGKALLALGGALIGPAGVALGFSVVSSAITVAVQKYGSFGAAVQALTGNLSDQQRAQASLNKEFISALPQYTQQIAQLQILSGLSRDASIGIEQQAKASKLLRQEVDGIVVSQNLAKDAQAEVSAQTVDYAKKVITARIILQGFNKVIGDTASEYAKAVIEGTTFTDFFVGAVNKINSFVIALKGGNLELAAQIARIDFANLAQKRYQDRVDDLGKSLGKSIEELNSFTRRQIAAGIQIDDLFGKEIKGSKEAEKQKAKSASAARKEADALKRRNDELERAAFVFDKVRARGIELPATGFAALQERALAAQKRAKQEQERQQFFGLGTIGPNDPALKRAQESVNRFIASTTAASSASLTAITQNANIAANVFGQTLGPAIDSVFNALAGGQDVFKALGQALKRLIVDLIATVAKAAILAGIISAVSGGAVPFSLAFRGALGAGGGATGGPLAGLFGGSRLRQVSAPTFGGGANISPSGLQLAGQVVFVQRGPDLVGVLNQGNARIGRVG